MNKILFDDYKKLIDTEKSELNYKFKDSPVGLRLIEFLEHCTNRNFKNTDAVAFVYKDDAAAVAYSVLENRYFKLRKKVHDELQRSSDTQSAELLTDEQLKLYRSKNLVSATNRDAAYKQLIELEKECWDKNIFELLPDIIDQLLFCNQSFNRLEKNKPLYLRLEKAIRLQHDINRCIMIARRVYEINYTKGIKHAKKELAALKELAAKNKAYPRFLMCYHHVSLYYKLGSHDYLFYMQAIGRHLSAFKKLFAKNPDIPLVSYKVNYTKNQHLHFNQITMFYHFNKCEFEEAYNSMKDTWELIHSDDSVLKIHKTESLYYNMITSQCMSGHYDEANETCNSFITFLKENNQYDKLSVGYVQKANVYAMSYPQTYKMDIRFLIDQVDEHIKKTKKSDNAQTPLHETLVLKLKLHLISKEYAKAKKIIADPIVKKYLESLIAYDLMLELVDILNDGPVDTPELLQELNKNTLQRRHKANAPGQFMQYNWIIHQTKLLQK